MFNPVLPTVQEDPLELKLNVIQFTEQNELVYAQVMMSIRDLDSPNLSRSTSTEILPTDFEILRPNNRSIATQTRDTIVISDDEEDAQDASTTGPNSSIQAGFIISDNTGQVKLLSKPSEQRPLFMLNFKPIAASTTEEPRGPSRKGKSAYGKGKSSSGKAPQEPLREVHLPNNKENDDPQDEDTEIVEDTQYNIPDNLQTVRTTSAKNTLTCKKNDNQAPLPSTSATKTTKTRPKRKRSGDKPTTSGKPKRRKIKKVIIIDQRIQTRMDRYIHTRSRLMRIQRSTSRSSIVTNYSNYSNIRIVGTK